MRILFVCTGNTCRSPLAEALFRQMVRQVGAKLAVASAGITVENDTPMSAHALSVLSERGLDGSGHHTRAVNGDLLHAADLVLTMTENHRRSLVRHWPAVAEKTFTLREYVGDTAFDVPDPFGGDLEAYRQTAVVLQELLVRLLTRLTTPEKFGI